jgi:hypothetical protein
MATKRARDVKSYADDSSSDEDKAYKPFPSESQESYTSVKSTKSDKSTGSRGSRAGAARTTRSSSGLSQIASHTGLSQGFDNWNLEEDTVLVPEERAQSFATVCVVHRPTTHKKQKAVKTYALQNTFFAFPKNINDEDKKIIDGKIQDVVADFETQKYTIERKTFGLPFEVEGVCRITPGYNMTAKKIKPAGSSKRRKFNEQEEAVDSPSTSDAPAAAGKKNKP